MDIRRENNLAQRRPGEISKRFRPSFGDSFVTRRLGLGVRCAQFERGGLMKTINALLSACGADRKWHRTCRCHRRLESERADAIAADKRMSSPAYVRLATLMHLAMFEALNAIDRRYQPYRLSLVADRNTSRMWRRPRPDMPCSWRSIRTRSRRWMRCWHNSWHRLREGPAKERGLILGRKAAAGNPGTAQRRWQCGNRHLSTGDPSRAGTCRRRPWPAPVWAPGRHGSWPAPRSSGRRPPPALNSPDVDPRLQRDS